MIEAEINEGKDFHPFKLPAGWVVRNRERERDRDRDER